MIRAILVAIAFSTPGFVAAAEGATVYAKSCAHCHGADGKAGSGKPIAGEAASFVKEVVEFHPPPMDKMKLSVADTDAVAKYVAGLKK